MVLALGCRLGSLLCIGFEGERKAIRLDEEAKERKNPQLNNNSFMHDSMSHAHTYLSVVVLALGCRLGSLLLMA